MMTIEIKQQIALAAKDYLAENSLSNNWLVEASGVNERYVSPMLNGDLKAGLKNGIGEIHFKKVAKTIGFIIEENYWINAETKQSERLEVELLDAKKNGGRRVIIGQTGCGKTYTIDQFMAKPRYADSSYRITVSDMHTVNDIINEWCEKLNVVSKGGRITRLKKVSQRLKDARLRGKYPILILDEAENLRLPALKMLKALYDAVKDHCAIVLIGTDQLTENLDKLDEKNIDGMPQFCRRFKAGRRILHAIEKERDFAHFRELVSDNNLWELLVNISNNYGELNDYLEPALREADKLGEPLTEKLFREMYRMTRED